MEQSCYQHYINSGAKMHAVNFSCLPEASSRLYVDWEATSEHLYTVQDEKKVHAAKIRKFIAAVQIMLEQMGITRYVQWVVENRTRQDPDSGLFKPSFHIYADVWFPNNYELLPAFVKEALRRANVSMDWVDFGVYQQRSLLRMIGVSSKTYHPLPRRRRPLLFVTDCIAVRNTRCHC